MGRILLGIVSILAAGAIGAYGLYNAWYPTFVYRYRLSITIDTPEGVKSGSSIIEVRTTFFPYTGDRDSINRVHGEAIFIDVGHGQNIVALLARGKYGEDVDYPWRLPNFAFQIDGSREALRSIVHRSVKRDLIKCQMPKPPTESSSCLPTFVRFRDPLDYASVEFIDSAHLVEAFGPGYVLKEAVVETANETATARLKTFLPWLPINTYLNGENICGPDDRFHCLRGGQFMRSF